MMENWTPLKHHQRLIHNKTTSCSKSISSNDGSLINTMPRLRAAPVENLVSNFSLLGTLGSSSKSLKSEALKGAGSSRNLQGS